MKLWDKIKAWWHKHTHKVCPICKIEQDNVEFANMWLTGQCDTCYWDGVRNAFSLKKVQEREARIEEMAEAIRRASPVGVSIKQI